MPQAKPTGLLKALYRAPAVLFRARLGWLLGPHFVMITTTGRKTGAVRSTVLETVRRQATPGIGGIPTIWVVSGYGTSSDWYANLRAGGLRRIDWMGRRAPGRAVFLDQAECTELLADYARRHPVSAKTLGRSVLGADFSDDPESIARLGAELRAIRLEPVAYADARRVLAPGLTPATGGMPAV